MAGGNKIKFIVKDPKKIKDDADDSKNKPMKKDPKKVKDDAKDAKKKVEIKPKDDDFNEVENEAFGGISLRESLRDDGITFTSKLLLAPIDYEKTSIKGYNADFKKRKKEIKKNIKDTLKEENTYKKFSKVFKIIEPKYFKYMKNYFKDIEK
tara:strand:+ start:101 stop:556 length:456 start_codon:yes stop_codon:yes gene_type:complete